MNTTIDINNIPIDKQLTHYLVNGTTTSEFNYMQKQTQRENNNVSNESKI